MQALGGLRSDQGPHCGPWCFSACYAPARGSFAALTPAGAAPAMYAVRNQSDPVREAPAQMV